MQEPIPGSWKQSIHSGTLNPWDLGYFSTAKLQPEYRNGFLGCMNRQEDEGRDYSLVLQQMWNVLSSYGRDVTRNEKIQVLPYASPGSGIPHPHLTPNPLWEVNWEEHQGTRGIFPAVPLLHWPATLRDASC